MSSQNSIRRLGGQKFTILMFNMSYWHNWQNGIKNRNYFVLQELLKRSEVNQIIAVDYLPMTRRKKVLSIMYYVLGIKYQVLGNHKNKLTIYTALSVKNVISNLKKILNTLYLIPNTKIILWSYFPLYIDYFDQIPADLKIFDAVDDWSKHPSYKNQRQLLQNNYRQIAKKADIIFTVSENLRQSLFKGQKNVYWIANGTDLKFQNPNLKSMSKSKCQKRKVMIGYVGVIQSRVDFKLVQFLAESHQDKEFVFVGPVWKDAEIKKVRGLKNIKFVGQISYDDLPKYLSKFDIGIIPHKINDFTRSMDPMKSYEYLAFGLPVVSTQKLTNDDQLLYFADNPTDFSQAISRALKENSQELIDRRQKFAQENSWERRVEEMMKIISNSKCQMSNQCQNPKSKK